VARVGPEVKRRNDVSRNAIVKVRLLAVAAAMLALNIGGCGALEIGPCTLELLDRGGMQMEPPYVAEIRQDGAIHPGASLTFAAAGWLEPHVAIIPPLGRRSEALHEPEAFNNRRAGVYLDSPGTWRIDVTDARAGCQATFVVEVV
jgi:hypothetical protein